MINKVIKRFAILATVFYGISLFVELVSCFVLQDKIMEIFMAVKSDVRVIDYIGIAMAIITFMVMLLLSIIVCNSESVDTAWVMALIIAIFMGVITLISPFVNAISTRIAFNMGGEMYISTYSALTAFTSYVRTPFTFMGLLFFGMCFGAICHAKQ